MKPLKFQLASRAEGDFCAVATPANDLILATGKVSEIKESILSAANDHYFDEGITYQWSDIELEVDLESLFAMFQEINLSAFANLMGMNRALLAQYASSTKKPSKKQKERIQKGINSLADSLSAMRIA